MTSKVLDFVCTVGDTCVFICLHMLSDTVFSVFVFLRFPILCMLNVNCQNPIFLLHVPEIQVVLLDLLSLTLFV